MLMKNCIIKKIANIFLAITILITSLMINVSPVKASKNYVNILHKISTATANSPINYNFDTYNSLTPNWYYKVLR